MKKKTSYLDYQFTDSAEFVSTFDELPLWSASFGLLLLKHLELKPNLTVLDIGSGAGFPLLELAERLGPSCRCIGIDPWAHANNRAQQKITNYDVDNAEIITASAAELPFEDGSIDLIVSNLGINNFENPAAVFKECTRVLKSGGKLALTTNLYGHWKEFYNIFYTILETLNRPDLLAAVKADEAHRGTAAAISAMLAEGGLQPSRIFEESFDMKFLDGTAFLNHYFVKLGWLSSWFAIIPETDRIAVFTALEQNLNEYAGKHGVLCLSVPMAFIEGQKA
ncbi:MAG: hypothetical protein JWQ38_1139 [Flavipsychrobacter sp.]|nr:hypothetical protein [Flavipsychrobacter sp.]